MNYTMLREKMVQEQIISRGVRDPRVLSAMYRVERHRFICASEQANSYVDAPMAIGAGQTISQPFMVALMTEWLALTGAEKVLEIGTGSGYQTAILAELARQVFTVERLHPLSHKASSTLKELGYSNISFSAGDGSIGWREEAPFDRIIVTAACPRIPFPLQEQLNEGGMILAPIGDNHLHQSLTLGTKKDGLLTFSTVCDCVFVPLIGEFGMFSS